MSLIYDGPVHPIAATIFVRNVPTPQDHKLNAILPDKNVADTRIEFASAKRNARTAPFRAFDGNIPELARDSVETKQLDLIPMSIRGSVGEYERLQLERVRQGGGNLAAITAAIYNDLTNGVNAIRNRIELARGELLSTGKITIAENDVHLKADYEVPLDHFVNAGVAWTDVETATVVGDLTTWVEKYTKTNGFAPGGMVLSRRTVGLLQRNAEFRKLLSVMQGTPGIVGQSAVDAILSDYGLPPINMVYDTVLPDVRGVNKRVIPEDKVIFVPPNAGDLGYTAFGVTETARELLSAAQTDLAFTDAPGLAGVVIKDGPPFREQTFVDALTLPVLENPNALFVADVY